MNAVRAGIIGGGFMAGVHAQAVRATGGAVMGIASRTRAGAQHAASQLGVDTAFETTDELLADPSIDVVHICTPNASHFELAYRAMSAGKHVVCEKPLALSTESAHELVNHAAQAGLIATVPFVYRFHPMVRQARAMVSSGNSSRMISVQGSYLQDWLLLESDDNWRVSASAGGPSRAFADIGSHLCDLIEFISGDRITRVWAQTRIAIPTRQAQAVLTEDVAAVMVQFVSGAIGTLLVSQIAPGRKNRLAVEIHTLERSVAFDQENPELLWVGGRTGSRQLLRNPEELHADAARLSTLPAGHPQGYQDAFNSFVSDTYAAIGGDMPDGLPTFSAGLRATQITEAVLESAQTSTWSNLPE